MRIARMFCVFVAILVMIGFIGCSAAPKANKAVEPVADKAAPADKGAKLEWKECKATCPKKVGGEVCGRHCRYEEGHSGTHYCWSHHLFD